MVLKNGLYAYTYKANLDDKGSFLFYPTYLSEHNLV